MLTKTLKLTCLLAVVLGGCTAGPDDFDAEPEAEPETQLADEEGMEAERGLVSEQAGADIESAPTAVFEDPAEKARIDEVRASTCTHASHDGALDALAFALPEQELARGLVDPHYRVESDEVQAGLDAVQEVTDEDLDAVHIVEDRTLIAQARYLDQADELKQDFAGSDDQLSAALAELKEREASE